MNKYLMIRSFCNMTFPYRYEIIDCRTGRIYTGYGRKRYHRILAQLKDNSR